MRQLHFFYFEEMKMDAIIETIDTLKTKKL